MIETSLDPPSDSLRRHRNGETVETSVPSPGVSITFLPGPPSPGRPRNLLRPRGPGHESPWPSLVCRSRQGPAQ
eukprot:1415781-Prymnesium_polylepis.1